MYLMDDLLSLARNEHAEELKLHIGKPPVIVRKGEQHVIEGPNITPENAEQFLLEITDTRQRRDLRERGWMHFFIRFEMA
jgi:Tfp pilus assembly pilus retraction ATPase PilT